MARWTDIAGWVGPTSARNPDAMARPPRGLVIHIASGFYDGTIAWQRRTSGEDRTSSHFIIGRDGRCAQMVDTADGSWAQKSGNNSWISVELEGFAAGDALHVKHPGWETATPQQVEVCARLLARANQVYGVPLEVATSPSGRGLGHHSMGAETGADWGHSLCPGSPIKAQKAVIVARAKALAVGASPASPAHVTEGVSVADSVLTNTHDRIVGILDMLAVVPNTGEPNILGQFLRGLDAKLDLILKGQGVAQADLDDIQARTGTVTLTAAQVAALAAHTGYSPEQLIGFAKAGYRAATDDNPAT